MHLALDPNRNVPTDLSDDAKVVAQGLVEVGVGVVSADLESTIETAAESQASPFDGVVAAGASTQTLRRA